jgi:hypothetical protein
MEGLIAKPSIDKPLSHRFIKISYKKAQDVANSYPFNYFPNKP